MLTRNGFLGLQRYSCAVWSGDISTRWEDMAAQLTAGLNLVAAGVPFWSMDIGGFSVERRYQQSQDMDEWQEMNLRWFQFGSFVPLFRSHGQGPYREIYTIAGNNTAIFNALKYYLELRYTLIPYIYSLAWRVHAEDYSIMRALVFDFPTDKCVWDITDQYMFGPAFMVCPILRYKQRTRPVYLPDGIWYDFYTGKGFSADIIDELVDRMPLFVRGGSIVITGPVIQSTATVQKDLIVTVYTGADASFTLYEDDGLTYAYEKGESTTIEFTYSEKSKRLTIGAIKGDFPGKIANRNLTVRVVPGDEQTVTSVEYTGAAVQVQTGPAPPDEDSSGGDHTQTIAIVITAAVIVFAGIIIVIVCKKQARLERYDAVG
jgi:alpha-D-xyloside xylohydrolase